MDQVYAVRQVCEQYLANGKDLFYAFMYLEKAYDAIYLHCVWSWRKIVENCRILCK